MNNEHQKILHLTNVRMAKSTHHYGKYILPKHLARGKSQVSFPVVTLDLLALLDNVDFSFVRKMSSNV